MRGYRSAGDARTSRRGYPADSRVHADDGFTLIEMLVVCMILPIVIGALGFALITLFSLQNSTENNVLDTADAQTVSAYYEQDVQSAAYITTSPNPQISSAANPTDNKIAQCGTGTQLLGMEWNPNPDITFVGTTNSTTAISGIASASTALLVATDPITGPGIPAGTTISSVAANSIVISQAATGNAIATFSVPGSGQYQTVVSYVQVGSRSPYSLVRQYCTNGSSTPTSTTYISTDIPSGLTPSICTSSCTGTGSWSTGWATAVGVTGITLSITEPGSNYSYALTSVPRASSAPGQLTSIIPPTSSCGFATPGTGAYASVLCFVDFSSYNGATPSSCQTMKSNIVNTQYTLSFCLGTTTTPSPGEVVPASLPTYTNPSWSEAFLGNNGFYTNVPGEPALYQNEEGSISDVDFTNIQLSDSNGNAAVGWELVTGDAETTDPGESLTWTSDKPLSLLDNSSTSAIGNACANPIPGDGLTPGNGLTFTPATNPTTVECQSSVPSNKTGTVMLQAPAPTRLSVIMVGSGLEAIFLGVILP